MKRRAPSRGRQRGVVAIEFAYAAPSFIAVMFIMMEVLRAMYVWNMLAAVTRSVARAAIVAAPANATDAVRDVRKNAILAVDDKSTAFGVNVTVDTIRVSYLNLQLNTVSALPPTGNDNVHTCNANPASVNCVRFVQVQVCEEATDCKPLQYKPVLPILPSFNMPSFVTILPAQSLGCTGDCT